MTTETLADGDVRFMALAVAAMAHNTQTYDGNTFVSHLLDVASVVEEFGLDSPHMIAAALLHDVIEDTDVELPQLQEIFPEPIPSLVWCLTDSTEGKNRAERKANTYAKTATNRAAVGLKLCDRISNVRASVAIEDGEVEGKSFLAMYQKEHEAFCEGLRVPGEYDALWETLDALLGFVVEPVAV